MGRRHGGKAHSKRDSRRPWTDVLFEASNCFGNIPTSGQMCKGVEHCGIRKDHIPPQNTIAICCCGDFEVLQQGEQGGHLHNCTALEHFQC